MEHATEEGLGTRLLSDIHIQVYLRDGTITYIMVTTEKVL